MTERLKDSMFGILSWMKEHQSVVSTSLDELSAQFKVTRELMQSQLQSLQRYECVKRGGRGNAAWSITDQGLVRLVEGKFTPRGAFLSAFDSTGRSFENPSDQAGRVTMITVPMAGDREKPDIQDPLLSSSPTSWPGQWDYFTRQNRRGGPQGAGRSLSIGPKR